MAQALDVAKYKIPAEKLRWHCDPSQFKFRCTEDLVPLGEFVGQERALKALEFGLAVERSGYNLFVTGLTGTGRTSAIQEYVKRAVESRKAEARRAKPNDWCYLYNFTDPDCPRAVRLPKGQGRTLKRQAEGLQPALRAHLIKAFKGEEYREHRKTLLEASQARSQELVQALQREAEQAGFLIQTSAMGVALFPLFQGRPMQPQEFMALPPSDRDALEKQQSELMKRVQETMEKTQAIERETVEKIQELDRKVAEAAVQGPFQELLQAYRDLPQVREYLEGLRAFVLEHVQWFLRDEKEEAPPPIPWPSARREPDVSLAFHVNVIVDNSRTEGPPIIVEHHPTWGALFGKIERKAFAGTYVSDHSMLKPGALHVANGGYLILNARDVLGSPGSWEGLKRAVKTRQVRIEDPYEAFGFLLPQGLRPEPIPLDVKVIVVGDNALYQLLARLDEEFWELFRVKADFDFEIERTPENLEAYAAFICGCCNTEGLLHFDPTGVARVAEYGARLVADQEKLSSRFGQVKEIVVEADYWARQRKHALVTGDDVEKAVEEKVYRSSLIAERIRKLIAEGTLMVDVEGAKLGQVNGLAVYDLGDIAFGKPSRITAKTFMGRRGVINIERESQLSGRIHDKGVLILSGYLGWKYAQDKPLSLAASICFEQSYEGVEGDSASSTELYAILSSLSDLPVRQDIAVTGSVNQHGEIQPIGGVNEKIEGFFDVCRTKGLTGKQGVIIPHQNVRNLMLREDVIEAVRQGQFHIYAVKTVDEGIEILTGTPGGSRGPNGRYPGGTVNFLVEKRLKELAEGIRRFYPEAGE